MADPRKFVPSYDFSDFAAVNPDTPLPGVQVDIQLSDLATSTSEIVEAIKNVRRSDGKLKNGIVTPDSLSAALSIGFTMAGSWTEGATYGAADGVSFGTSFYKARVANTANELNRPDLDATTWMFLFTFSSVGIADGSITAPKLDATDAENIREVIGQEELVADGVANASAETTLADADFVPLTDTSASGVLKKITVANFAEWIRTKLGALIAASTIKATPVDADTLPIADSESSGATKSLSFANLKATLKAYFDTLYMSAASAVASFQPLSSKLTTFSALANGSGVLTNDGAGVLSWGAPIDVQKFTASGTWTKPAKGTVALIRCWGAGGGGGGPRTSGSGGASGGGGGSFVDAWFPLSALGATETVTIGAGGTGGTSGNPGQVGGSTTFGSKVTAYGGGGGGSPVAGPTSNGGQGGSLGAAGGSGTTQAAWPTGSTGGGTMFATSASQHADVPGAGAAGGYGGSAGNAAGAGGQSIYGGGGGGGGGGSSSSGAAGGNSVFGGDGGAGANSSTAGTAGSAPGGGGGGVYTGTPGVGARGQCEVYVF